MGTELIGITAGESATPEKSIPKAIKQVFWRILLFYILSIFVIACIIPYTSPSLLGSEATDIAMSPFTLVFQRAGLAAAAAVMNAVVLTSVISAANSGMYASTRMLYALAKEKHAPGIFGMVNFHGIPIPALLGTTFVAFLTFLTSIFGNDIYIFLVAASGLTGFIAWPCPCFYPVYPGHSRAGPEFFQNAQLAGDMCHLHVRAAVPDPVFRIQDQEPH